MNSAEFSQALSSMDPTELALGAGLIGIIGTLFVVGGIAWFFISALGYYKMFQKAGEKGWLAFIPLVRDYICFKFAWGLKPCIIYLVSVVGFNLASKSENLLLGLISIAFGIATIVFQAKLCSRMAASFGKGTGWAFFLFFLPFIATIILGFGKAQYIGNTTVAPAEGEN